MKSFWFTLKDNDNMTYDVHGPISNDDSYNEMVVKAQRNSYEITCDTPPATYTEKEVCVAMENYGFKRDKDLFSKDSMMGMKEQKD